MVGINTLLVICSLQEGCGKKEENVPDWLDGDILSAHPIGSTSTTAQVPINSEEFSTESAIQYTMTDSCIGN